jgi:predicted DNA-binding transcriptional regulator AlpA
MQALMEDPGVSIKQIFEWFGVSKATLYGYVSPDGGT